MARRRQWIFLSKQYQFQFQKLRNNFFYCIDFLVSAEELGKFIDLFGRAVHEKLSDISAQDFLSFIPNTGFRFFNMIHSM